jgi:hypothetical protein
MWVQAALLSAGAFALTGNSLCRLRMRVSVRKRTNASPSLREICERGYDGSIGQLKAWLAPLKTVAPEPVVFETPPGQRMQPTSRSFAAAAIRCWHWCHVGLQPRQLRDQRIGAAARHRKHDVEGFALRTFVLDQRSAEANSSAISRSLPLSPDHDLRRMAHRGRLNAGGRRWRVDQPTAGEASWTSFADVFRERRSSRLRQSYHVHHRPEKPGSRPHYRHAGDPQQQEPGQARRPIDGAGLAIHQ